MEYSSLFTSMSIPTFPTIFLTSAISLVFLKIVLRAIWGRPSLKKLPPGPSRIPVLGSVHHLRGGPPHHRFRDLSKEFGPLMMLKLGEMSTLVVSSPEMAKEVMKTHDAVFAQRPRHPAADIILYGCTNITFSPVGDHWKLLRKLCALEMVNAKSVRKYQALRGREESSLMRDLSQEAKTSSVVNLTDKIFSTVFGIVSRAAYGENYNAREELFSIVERLMKSASVVSICELFPSQDWLAVITGMRSKWEKMHRSLDPVLDKIISATKAAPSGFIGGDADSLLSAMLSIQEDGGLTLDHVKAVMLDMIFGGTETSSATTEWAMTELLRKPNLMKKAQAEVRQVISEHKGCINETTIDGITYIKTIVKETLRLHPPAPFLSPRERGRTCELNGYTIPVGTQVLVNAWAINRDPNYWSSPEEFMPERFLNLNLEFKGFNFEYIPFGSGKRVCPGMLFGVATVESMLTHLLYHFDWELPPGTTPETLDVTDTLGTTMKKKTPLFAIPKCYS